MTAWNAAMEAMSGLSAAQMIGAGRYAYARPFYGTQVPILIDCALAGTEPPAKSYTTYHRDGDSVSAEAANVILNGSRITCGRPPVGFAGRTEVLSASSKAYAMSLHGERLRRDISRQSGNSSILRGLTAWE